MDSTKYLLLAVAATSLGINLLSSNRSITHKIEMGKEYMSFSPEVLRISVGDTVKFEPYGYHNTQSIDGMIPPKTKKWKSKMGKLFIKHLINQILWLQM